MAGFLYFLSGSTQAVNKDGVAKLGLAYAFTGNVEHRATTGNSPSGKSGVVFAEDTRHGGKTIGYYPDKQTWRKLPNLEGRPELWVGYWNDAKPGPEDLKRGNMLRGPKIMLADGNAWQVPIVRRFDDSAQRWESELPAYIDCDENGKPYRGQPIAEHMRLWDLTAPLAAQQFSKDAGDEGATGPTDEDVYAAVIALLQANYLVDLPELVSLHALKESDLATVCMVACRYQELMSWFNDIQKKTDDPSEPSGLTVLDTEAA